MKIKNLLVMVCAFVSLQGFSSNSWGNEGGGTGTGPGSGEYPASNYYNSFDTSTVHYWNLTGQYWGSVNLLLANAACDYFHPVNGAVTSNFGKRRRRMHYGIDIDLETGDSVATAFEGMVRFAKYNSSYGNLVIVRHPNGLETYYAHLSKINVQAGQYVQAGENLGLGGNTGRSFGAHLHFEVRFLGTPIDPNKLIDFQSKKLRYETIELHAEGKGLDLANAAKFHKVAPGEDVYSISRLYGISIQKILELNDIAETEMLVVDSKIRYN